MHNASRVTVLLAGIGLSLTCHADMIVKINKVSPEGIDADIGTVTITQTDDGVRFKPDLKGLKPGEHGFHVHEKPTCKPAKQGEKPVAALAAGGHYDPDKTGHHRGPYGNGHRGDLPRLVVDSKGMATEAVVAPRLTLKELKGHSLMIHKGGDNYSDNPPMGGGGPRIACGVIR